ncbi:MAG: hypothetical protein LBP22_11010 [Deltaproteobacteria bacterium]|jgi:hypothetical protein|nr:hypothetical protein [Deltaproteobacteria bacterium]
MKAIQDKKYCTPYATKSKFTGLTAKPKAKKAMPAGTTIKHGTDSKKTKKLNSEI